MPNPYINIRTSGSSSLDGDARAYISYLTTTPSVARQNIINTLVKQLKGDGNWSLIDRLWLHASESKQAATISLVNPSSTACTEVNSPAWVADQGYTGDGATSYLNTNYNPATNAVNYTQNNGSILSYTRSDIAEGGVLMGGRAALNGCILNSENASNNANGRINAATGATVAITTSTGLFAIERTSSTLSTLYRNGSSLGTTPTVSQAIDSQNIYICAFNVNGSAGSFSTRQISISGIGSGDINALTFYNAIQAYMTSLGTQV